MNTKKNTNLLFALLIIILTLLFGSSLLWEISNEKKQQIEYAKVEALASFNKDLLYRRWASMHGGVYVPVTEFSPPNPYLEYIPERDITTESGKKLTLMNPAYMTRQVLAMAIEQYGVKGHITSLNPIRPENKADEWETKVLQLFEKGETEYSSIEQIDGKKYLRSMFAMKAEQNCLTCHAKQGYMLGEIRGGISVSVPMEPYQNIQFTHIKNLILTYLSIYLGLLILAYFVYKRFLRINLKNSMAQAQIQESEYRYNLAMKASNDGLFDWNLETNAIYYSPGWKKMIGYEDNELPNDFSVWEEATNPEDIKKLWELQKKLINKEVDRFVLEFKMKHKNGHWVDILSQAEVIFDDAGKATRIVGTHTDITERKLVEEELLFAKDKAEESDRLKSAFLANMSHEIRTPMNGILGFTDLLKEPKLSGAEQEKYISVIESSGTRLLSTVNDIIDFSKIEAGQTHTTVSKVNINEITKQLYTFFNGEAQKKGLQLLLNNSYSVNHLRLQSDREKIYSILTNLIKNAIKYSKSGSSEFGYKIIKNDILFFVKDTGVGIPKEKFEFIFDRFIRVGKDKEHFTEGSGLGLSISKAYVEMLGGKIWVESEVGVGSQFYFTIPYKPEKDTVSLTKEVDSEVKSEPHIKDLKILIAEDDESSTELLKIILKGVASEIIHVLNGREAVNHLKNNPDIDLILMDINMPEMNGYEATKQIREFNKDVIIISQTAYALAGDYNKSIEAGCDDHISKPLNKKILLDKIEKCLIKI